MIFMNIKCQWDFIMGKTRSSTLRLSSPTYCQRGIRAQENSDSLRGFHKSLPSPVRRVKLIFGHFRTVPGRLPSDFSGACVWKRLLPIILPAFTSSGSPYTTRSKQVRIRGPPVYRLVNCQAPRD